MRVSSTHNGYPYRKLVQNNRSARMSICALERIHTLWRQQAMLRVGFRRWSCVNSLFVNRRDELRHISGSPAACLFCSRTRDPSLAVFTPRLWNFDSWIFEKPFELSCLFIYFRLLLLPHLTFPSPTPPHIFARSMRFALCTNTCRILVKSPRLRLGSIN